MTEKSKEVTDIAIADMFPSLSESELKEVQEALEAYSSLALQIFTRLERERNQRFDGPPAAS